MPNSRRQEEPVLEVLGDLRAAGVSSFVVENSNTWDRTSSQEWISIGSPAS
jgi:hypothetical protein